MCLSHYLGFCSWSFWRPMCWCWKTWPVKTAEIMSVSLWTWTLWRISQDIPQCLSTVRNLHWSDLWRSQQIHFTSSATVCAWLELLTLDCLSLLCVCRSWSCCGDAQRHYCGGPRRGAESHVQRPLVFKNWNNLVEGNIHRYEFLKIYCAPKLINMHSENPSLHSCLWEYSYTPFVGMLLGVTDAASTVFSHGT